MAGLPLHRLFGDLLDADRVVAPELVDDLVQRRAAGKVGDEAVRAVARELLQRLVEFCGEFGVRRVGSGVLQFDEVAVLRVAEVDALRKEREVAMDSMP